MVGGAIRVASTMVQPNGPAKNCRGTTEKKPYKQSRARSESCEERNFGKTNGENQQQIKQVMSHRRTWKRSRSPTLAAETSSRHGPQRLTGTQQAISNRLRRRRRNSKSLWRNSRSRRRQRKPTLPSPKMSWRTSAASWPKGPSM